jgi:hypothetical protein
VEALVWRFGLRTALTIMGQGEFMNCQETIRLICDYLEGRLAPSVEREISQHLTKCATCYLVLEAAEQTLEVYFDVDPARLPHPHTV